MMGLRYFAKIVSMLLNLQYQVLGKSRTNGTLRITSETIRWYSTLENRLTISYKVKNRLTI